MTTRLDLPIEGMTCASCAGRVEKKLNRLDGVTATVNFATEKAQASVPATVSAADLIAVVRQAGYTVAEPQPAPDSVTWQGQTAADGVVYVQVCPRVDGSGLAAVLVFVANGAAPPAPPVDPRVLAEQAIASLVMRAPEIRMAPPPGSTSGLVGLPVWMWIEPGEEFLGPARPGSRCRPVA